MPVIVVTGTGTEVGKTFVAAALLRALVGAGTRVAARKPVQSFAPGTGPTDAEVLAAATGEDPYDVCPRHRWLSIPMAPPMAAEALGTEPFTIADLVRELVVPVDPRTVTVVEGAGGVRSPLAADGDTRDLATALAADVVVLVADAGLGAINLVALSVGALGPHRVVVALNRHDPQDDLHRRNHLWLTTRLGLEVVTDPEALAAVLEPD